MLQTEYKTMSRKMLEELISTVLAVYTVLFRADVRGLNNMLRFKVTLKPTFINREHGV